MADQRIAYHAALAGDDIEHAGRQARFERQFTDAQCRQRCDFRGFDDHGAAACQRRRDLPHADHQREIPRHDRGHHADRFAHGIGQRIGAGRYHVAVDLVGPAGVVAHGVDHRRHILPTHGGQRLAGVKAFQCDQLVAMGLEQIGEALQDAATLGGTHAAPALQRAARGLHRQIDLGRTALCDQRDRSLGGGIDVGRIGPGNGRDALGADQQIVPRQRGRVGPDRRTRRTRGVKRRRHDGSSRDRPRCCVDSVSASQEPKSN